MQTPLAHQFIDQPDVTKEEFIEANIQFILQLATVYLAKCEHTTVTDKLTEALLRDLMHTTLKVNYVQNKRLEPTASIKAFSYSPQLCKVLSLDKNFPIQKITHDVSRYFDLSEAAAWSIIWPNWARSIYRKQLERFVLFAENIMNVDSCENEEETALKGIHAMEKFFQILRLPTNFEALGIYPTDYELKQLSQKAGGAECFLILKCSR